MKTVCCAGIAAVLLTIVALTDARGTLAQTAAPASYRVGPILVEAPWSREAPGGVRRAVGYMRITNTGQQADRLVGGTAAGPGRLEVHQSVTADGFARMQAVAEGLVIGPGETVELKPGGPHVMLVDLRQGPKAGEIIKGTLVFEKAGMVDIEYQVGGVGIRSAPTAAAGHHHH
ncbi:copper chaperone PCu(A)C [Microvirga aerilata]|uniref:Copper chaperone PCu(A)C n=1 Tax=Microvirga aerilata TaxID=670292 RepID=A0A936ZP51_9HYPH|nr:copper chaperone PCu(A)C [Microvirga aerilata]MBL0408128.1 copper chaperone PCu(A)C [Microvirga aerilata]